MGDLQRLARRCRIKDVQSHRSRTDGRWRPGVRDGSCLGRAVLVALLLASWQVAPARAKPRVTAIETRGSATVDGGTAEATESWFRDGCFVRQTRAPLPDRGPTRTDEIGCVAAGILAKMFEDADRCASRPGLVRARSTSPPVGSDGEAFPDIVLVLADGTRWRAHDENSAGDLMQLLDTLAEAGGRTTRGLSLIADGTALSPASRSSQVFVGLGADGRWRCGRILSGKALSAKSKGPPPRRPHAVAVATVARLVDSLLDGITPAMLAPRGDASLAKSRWGTVSVEVTLGNQSDGKLEAASALRVAERFSLEATSFASLCALP